MWFDCLITIAKETALIYNMVSGAGRHDDVAARKRYEQSEKMTTDVVIEGCRISHTYARTGWRLGPMDLAVRGAVLTGIIGPNGSGKSTLLSILARRLSFAGELTVSSKLIREFTNAEWARTVAYLPQRVPMEFDFSVGETVAFGRYARTGLMGFLGREDHEVVEQCLRQTDLLGLRGRMLSELSGGEVQRVHLASVLAQEPSVLFLDEPTTSLDIHHQIAFYRVIRRCVEAGMTAVLVTHELTLASQFCDELVLLSDGEIVRHGTAEDVVREELIQRVYGEAVRIVAHPETGRPMVVPGGIGGDR